MPETRQLRLGAFMRPVSIHTAAWRYPGAYPDANFNFGHLKRFAQTLERGKFDAFFMADHLAVLNMPMEALKRSATATSFDPLTLLPALAVVTERLGLVATASTTFEQPYHVARKFASLDHLSDGRAGWNIVTTSNPDAALNFGLDDHVEHDERYRRAREFYDVVTGLWDSWADDAFIRDVDSGIFLDPARMHVLGPQGRVPVRARPAEHRPADPGLAGDRAGRRVRGRPAARRRNRRGGVRQPARPGQRACLLRRREGPDGAARPRSRAPEDPARARSWWSATRWPRRRRRSAASTDWCIPTAASPPCPSSSAPTRRSFDLDEPLPEIPETNASQSGRRSWSNSAGARA